MKAPDGTTRNYNFSSTYNVGEPNVVVSPTAMNVMYMGIPNPIDVSVPGVSPNNIRIRVVNGSFTTEKVKNSKGQNFRGNWAVKPNAVGQNVQIIVSAVDESNKQTSFPPVEFRVKPLPSPIAVFANKNTGSVPKTQLPPRQAYMLPCLISTLTLYGM